MPFQSVSDARDDEEYTLPSVEALLAGTLALMTGVMQAAPRSASEGPMAARIVDNLRQLAGHPALSEPMRQMLTRLQSHWQPAASLGPAEGRAGPGRAHWLRGSAVLQ